MLEAMSTGDGSLCTLHARSAQHAIDRIVTLCLSAGVSMTDAFAYRLLAGSVDLFVHVELLDDTATRRPAAPVRLPGRRDRRPRRSEPARHDHRLRTRARRPRGPAAPTRSACPTWSGPASTPPCSTTAPAPGTDRWSGAVS